MFKPYFRILLKLMELCACIGCVLTKTITDQESRRIAARNQKLSMEWDLLTNVTWSREGNAFANITYGGYTVIVALLLIKRIINSTARPSMTEKILLAVGFLFFIVIGGLTLASLEQIPYDLSDNAIVLGSLSLFVSLLFLIDLADPKANYASNFVQTEKTSRAQNLSDIKIFSPSKVEELNSSHSQLHSFNKIVVKPNGNYSSGETIDKAYTKMEPTVQTPTFSYILSPEKPRSQIVEAKKRRTLTTVSYDKNHDVLNATQETYRKFPGIDMESECTYDISNLINPNQQGFVKKAARMWDKTSHAKNKTNNFSTIV